MVGMRQGVMLEGIAEQGWTVSRTRVLWSQNTYGAAEQPSPTFSNSGCVFDTLLILIRVCMNTKALCFKAVFHIISDSNYFSGMDRVHDDSFTQHCVKILCVCAHVKFSGKRLFSFH